MARINIEESLATDPRFRALVRMIGEVRAWGAWVVAARTAQEYWKRGEEGVPDSIWSYLEHHQELIDCGLASKQNEANGSKVYLRGSKDHFGWLQKRSEAGQKGGKASGETRRHKSSNLTEAKRSKGKQNEPSSSSSLVSTNYVTSENSSGGEVPAPPALPVAHQGTLLDLAPGKAKRPVDQALNAQTQEFIRVFAEAHKARWGTRPDLRGKRIGQIQGLIRDCESFPELLELVQVYTQSNDPYFLKRSHDFQTFAENLGKVRIMMHHGREVEDVAKDSKRTIEDQRWIDRMKAKEAPKAPEIEEPDPFALFEENPFGSEEARDEDHDA